VPKDKKAKQDQGVQNQQQGGQQGPSPQARQSIQQRSQSQVGAALAPGPTPAEQLSAQGQTYVDGKVAGQATYVHTKLEAVVADILKPGAAGFKEAAAEEIKTQITGAGGGATGQEKNDASARSNELAQESDAVKTAIESGSTEIVNDVLGAVTVNATISAAGLKVFTDAAPKTDIPAQVTALQPKADAAMLKAADGVVKAQKDATKLAAKRPAVTDRIKALARQSIGTVGTQEVQSRHDSSALVDGIVDPIALAQLNVIKDAIVAYLENGLGANGAGSTRSPELKAFRAKMKAAARAQAGEDIDTELDPTTNSQLLIDKNKAGAGEAERRFYAMKARSRAYNPAKEVVNQQMKLLAQTGLGESVDDVATQAALAQAASTAAWSTLRNDDSDPAKAQASKDALAAAKTKGKELGAAAKVRAKAWKSEIVNKDFDPDSTTVDTQAARNAGAATAGDAQATNVQDTVKEAVHGEGPTERALAKKVVKQTLEADSIGTGWTLMGKIIDLAVPSHDEGCKVEFELKLPVGGGGYCILVVGGTAERGQKNLTVGFNLEFGAGWQTFGIGVDGRINIFIEACGADTDKTMKLLSYGAYRNLCAMGGPFESVATFFTNNRQLTRGMKDTSGTSKAEESEIWAAMVEEYAMNDDDSYVDVGVGGRATGKVDAGALKMDGSVGGGFKRHYSKEQLAKMGYQPGELDTKGKTRDQRKQEALAKRKDVSGGDVRGFFALDLNAEYFFANVGRVGFNGNLKYERGKGLDVKLAAKMPYDVGNTPTPTKIQDMVGNFAASSISVIKQGIEAIRHKSELKDPVKDTGGVLDFGENVYTLVDGVRGYTGNMSDTLNSQLANSQAMGEWTAQNQPSEMVDQGLAKDLGTGGAPDSSGNLTQFQNSANSFSASSSLELSIGFAIKDGALESFKFDVATTKKMEISAFHNLGAVSGAGMKMSVEKRRALGIPGYERPKP
jgi:hypothetical protein